MPLVLSACLRNSSQRWLSHLEELRQITGFPQLVYQRHDDGAVCLAAGECRVKWQCLEASTRQRLEHFKDLNHAIIGHGYWERIPEQPWLLPGHRENVTPITKKIYITTAIKTNYRLDDAMLWIFCLNLWMAWGTFAFTSVAVIAKAKPRQSLKKIQDYSCASKKYQILQPFCWICISMFRLDSTGGAGQAKQLNCNPLKLVAWITFKPTATCHVSFL